MAPAPDLLSLPRETCLLVFAKLDVVSLLGMAATCTAMKLLIKEDMLWKQLAAAKWGQKAVDLGQKPVENSQGGWFDYCKHRLCIRSHPISPLNLIQEQYHDPWQHLVCCLLCSRTSGSQVIKMTIKAFLGTYGTPSKVLEAPDEELESFIDPLGLQETRIKAVKQMSQAFFEKEWEDPVEFYGCGKFTSDSWRIFCRGVKASKGVEDATLLRYLRWLNTGSLKDPKPARPRMPKDKRSVKGASGSAIDERSKRRHTRSLRDAGNTRALRRRTNAL